MDIQVGGSEMSKSGKGGGGKTLKPGESLHNALAKGEVIEFIFPAKAEGTDEDE